MDRNGIDKSVVCLSNHTHLELRTTRSPQSRYP